MLKVEQLGHPAAWYPISSPGQLTFRSASGDHFVVESPPSSYSQSDFAILAIAHKDLPTPDNSSQGLVDVERNLIERVPCIRAYTSSSVMILGILLHFFPKVGTDSTVLVERENLALNVSSARFFTAGPTRLTVAENQILASVSPYRFERTGRKFEFEKEYVLVYFDQLQAVCALHFCVRQFDRTFIRKLEFLGVDSYDWVVKVDQKIFGIKSRNPADWILSVWDQVWPDLGMGPERIMIMGERCELYATSPSRQG